MKSQLDRDWTPYVGWIEDDIDGPITRIPLIVNHIQNYLNGWVVRLSQHFKQVQTGLPHAVTEQGTAYHTYSFTADVPTCLLMEDDPRWPGVENMIDNMFNQIIAANPERDHQLTWRLYPTAKMFFQDPNDPNIWVEYAHYGRAKVGPLIQVRMRLAVEPLKENNNG